MAQNSEHLMGRSDMKCSCTMDNLVLVNDKATFVADFWKSVISDAEEKEEEEEELKTRHFFFYIRKRGEKSRWTNSNAVWKFKNSIFFFFYYYCQWTFCIRPCTRNLLSSMNDEWEKGETFNDLYIEIKRPLRFSLSKKKFN